VTKHANETGPNAVGIPVERGVRPVAEIVGGVLRWHIPEPDYALAQHYLRGVHLLYDQAALDAAVAAERERCAKMADEYATYGGGGNFYDWFKKLAAAIGA
jgi:hypothetical protein